MRNDVTRARPGIQVSRPVLAVLACLWVIGVALGLRAMWGYENQAGSAATPPAHLVSRGSDSLSESRPTLLLLAHPRCPCTSASIEELARVVASAHGGLDARVYFYKPVGAPDAWAKTALWRHAASIPGVQVLVDEDGRTAYRYGAATSGQALLYGADGRLLFSGGVTDSRGHSGESVGGSTILALLANPTPISGTRSNHVSTPIYGCSLKSPVTAASTPTVQ